MSSTVVFIVTADDRQQSLAPRVDLDHPYRLIVCAINGVVVLADREADDVRIIGAHDGELQSQFPFPQLGSCQSSLQSSAPSLTHAIGSFHPQGQRPRRHVEGGAGALARGRAWAAEAAAWSNAGEPHGAGAGGRQVAARK
jgi:hypothetical protein